MLNEKIPSMEKPKTQVEVDQHVIDFLGDMDIKSTDDLVKLRDKMESTLESKPYNDETKEHADSIQWKRTASEIIKDGYVYEGKSCSDLALVFLTVCKAAGVEGCLVKMVTLKKDDSHSIVEVTLNGILYRFDSSVPEAIPREGQLTDEIIRKYGWKIWKRARDLWELGLKGIEDEEKVYE